jgi:4-hydroxy-tetrahydrodipicolinate synthase
MSQLQEQLLFGSFTPLITPFIDGAIDYVAYAKLVDWQIKGGTNGVIVSGTSGEPLSLSSAERKNLLRVAISSARGRVPVVAQVGASSALESKDLACHAQQVGADVIMLMMPVFAKPPQRALVAYSRYVLEHVSKPILLYQIPSRTASKIEFDTLLEMCKILPNIVGLKQSEDDIVFDATVISRLGKKFRLFMGLSNIAFERLPHLASGLIVALSNVVPDKVAMIFNLANAGDTSQAAVLVSDYNALNTVAFNVSNPIGVKYMLYKMGVIPSYECRLPLVGPDQEHQEMISKELRFLKLI